MYINFIICTKFQLFIFVPEKNYLLLVYTTFLSENICIYVLLYVEIILGIEFNSFKLMKPIVDVYLQGVFVRILIHVPKKLIFAV